jgi:hypothetical protein
MPEMTWVTSLSVAQYRGEAVRLLREQYCDQYAADLFADLNYGEVMRRYDGISPQMAALKHLDNLDIRESF